MNRPVVNYYLLCYFYYGLPNIFENIVLINLYTMDPFELPRALSTMVDNDFSKLSMINTSGGFHYQLYFNFSPGEQMLMPV